MRIHLRASQEDLRIARAQTAKVEAQRLAEEELSRAQAEEYRRRIAELEAQLARGQGGSRDKGKRRER